MSSSAAPKPAHQPNDLDALWLPFTPNRSFKRQPRMVADAKGMYYTGPDGRKILDMFAGLWCVNAGHCHPKITAAIKEQAEKLDYSPLFNLSHPVSFEAASRLVTHMPANLQHVFFSNSGSEAVDTSLKIALAYWRAKGKGEKTKFIGRERGYNGVGFGGISVGGIYANRKAFSGNLLPNVDHLQTTAVLSKQAYSKGQPEWGAELADELERKFKLLTDPETVAAVIIEPVAGSTGVLPPPKGYLERIREICTKYNVLLIMDEVITAWGRLGKATGSEYFGIKPDMITSAKGINNGAVPMGATFVSNDIYDAFMHGPEYISDIMHGYTYSGHPLACAAALATMEVYKEEGLWDRVSKIAPVFEKALHSLKGLPHVIDIRNMGLMGAVELDPGSRGTTEMLRTQEVFHRMFFEENIVIRYTGNVLTFSPAFIVTESQIDETVTKFAKVLKTVK